jgi:hypothetical protein
LWGNLNLPPHDGLSVPDEATDDETVGRVVVTIPARSPVPALVPSTAPLAHHAASPSTRLVAVPAPRVPHLADDLAFRPGVEMESQRFHPGQIADVPPALPAPSLAAAADSVTEVGTGPSLVGTTVDAQIPDHNNPPGSVFTSASTAIGRTAIASTAAGAATTQALPPPEDSLPSDNPFCQHVSIRNMEAILASVERDPTTSSTACEALAALAVVLPLPSRSDPCDMFVAMRGIERIMKSLGRHGRRDSSLCLSFLRCVEALAESAARIPGVEHELRATGCCRAVVDCITWHPAMESIASASIRTITVLAASSPAMCSLLVQRGGTTCIRRALARSFGSFNVNINLAVASLRAVVPMAETRIESILEDGILGAVLQCCLDFSRREIDEHAVCVFQVVAKTEVGRDKLLTIEVADVNGLEVISQIFPRCYLSPIILRRACNVVSELATAPDHISSAAFSRTSIIESVLNALSSAELVQSRDVAVGLASDALDALRAMARVGGDQCGAMEMSGCGGAAMAAIRRHPSSRDVAIRGSLLAEAIASTPGGAGLASIPTRDFFASLLTTWQHDQNVTVPVQRTVAVLAQALSSQMLNESTGDGEFDGATPSNSGPQFPTINPPDASPVNSTEQTSLAPRSVWRWARRG